jgi:hypothetical protein
MLLNDAMLTIDAENFIAAVACDMAAATSVVTQKRNAGTEIWHTVWCCYH